VIIFKLTNTISIEILGIGQISLIMVWAGALRCARGYRVIWKYGTGHHHYRAAKEAAGS
jgi:hypothetical protein